MAHTLDEVDTMVNSCAAAGVPLNCGAITTTDPSFGKAKELLQSGAIGELLSIEANGPGAQHQGWSYFLDSEIDYCVGFGHSGAVRSCPPPLTSHSHGCAMPQPPSPGFAHRTMRRLRVAGRWTTHSTAKGWSSRRTARRSSSGAARWAGRGSR